MRRNRTIPFGYTIINGKYEINETEASAVKEVFRSYLSGMSLKAIASQMTVPYHESKAAWNKNTVSRALENRKYAGENGFPQIIRRAEFEQVQQIKRRRRTRKSKTRTAEKAYVKPNMCHIAYEPTEEISKVTNEINRLLDAESTDENEIRSKIFECLRLKYAAIKEERSDDHGNCTGT